MQLLVVTPTRELAVQVANEANGLLLLPNSDDDDSSNNQVTLLTGEVQVSSGSSGSE